jgi:hypothetical protein
MTSTTQQSGHCTPTLAQSPRDKLLHELSILHPSAATRPSQATRALPIIKHENQPTIQRRATPTSDTKRSRRYAA